MIRNDFARTEAGARDRAPGGAEAPNIGNRRVAELEAENAALRQALADAGAEAKLAATRHGTDLSREKAGRAIEVAEAQEASAGAEAHHGREMAASRSDLAASEESNAALRRANLALAESRAALRESQEKLRLILDSTADYAIFSMDTERRVASWNTGAERLLGWSEKETLGRSADVIFIPEDREAGVPQQEGEGALGHGRAADERWHQRKDGTRFWANGLMLPLRDPDAGTAAPPLGLLKVMRDETGKRRAEEALREGEARWRGLFERMHEGFALCEMVYGPDGEAVDYRHLQLNAAWERLIGTDSAATVGRLATEAIPGLDRFWIDTYARVVETGEPARVERYVPPLRRWCEVFAYRTEPGRFAALFLDVTERKAAEARRDALVELGDRLRDLREPAEIARAAAEIIGRALGAARAGYGTVDAAQEVFRVERDWTDGRVHPIAREHRLSEYWDDFAALYGKGGPVAIRDVAHDPRTAARAAAYAAAEVRALLDVPVVEEGRVVAILYVHDAVPRAWTAEEVGFVRGVAERAWAASERVRAERRRALLLGELNHRVKNTLAVVQSLAAQTARGAPDLPSFGAAFQARLIALARAHDLLTRENWEGAALGDVVRAALEPGGEARVDLGACGGRDMPLLAPPQALALALALHELGTNALKHGALSVPGGRVSVRCGTDPEDGAHVVEWLERGGPPIAAPPARRGFGLRLLERGLAAQTGMSAVLRFEPEGVRCTLRLPPVR